MSRWLLLHRGAINFSTHAKGVVKIVGYGDVRCKRTGRCWITCDRDGISNEYWQAVKKTYNMSVLLITALSVFGIHELQILRRTKGNPVTVVALATVFGLRKGWFWYTIIRHGQTVNSDPYIV